MISSINGGRLLGYARVSTDDQDLSLPIDALEKHGIGKSLIFQDKLSGAKSDRPGLAVARARGRRGGRPRLDSDQAKVRTTKKLHGDKSITIDGICETLNISRSTYYRYLALEPEGLPESPG